MWACTAVAFYRSCKVVAYYGGHDIKLLELWCSAG